MSSFKHFVNSKVITEAANNSFADIINDAIPDPEDRRVYGTYDIPNKSFQLDIDPADAETFSQLFKLAPDKTIGNGEISLYWLFNYGGGPQRAFETRGGT